MPIDIWTCRHTNIGLRIHISKARASRFHAYSHTYVSTTFHLQVVTLKQQVDASVSAVSTLTNERDEASKRTHAYLSVSVRRLFVVNMFRIRWMAFYLLDALPSVVWSAGAQQL